MSKILITGVTGHLGAAVLDKLLEKTPAANLAVLVRTEEKGKAFKAKAITVKTGDYADYASLLEAFRGIDKIYLVSGNDLENRGKQQENVIKAAKEAGVKQVVYTSFQRKNESSTSPIALVASSHLSTEQHLRASGINYTILKHGLYTDLIPQFAGEKVLETGTIYLPAGEGKTAFALRTDLAEAGAIVLLDDTEKYARKELILTGTEAISWKEIAGDITAITGKTISYISPSASDFNSTLTGYGVPAEIIMIVAGFSTGMAETEFDAVSPDLEAILGRKPVSVKTYLETVYS